MKIGAEKCGSLLINEMTAKNYTYIFDLYIYNVMFLYNKIPNSINIIILLFVNRKSFVSLRKYVLSIF